MWSCQKKWSVISMVKFNPVHLNMHRQGPNGMGTSFINTELPRRPICALVCVCACIAQIPSLLDAEGKMMGAGREQQSNRAFKPPVRRREIRIFFFSSLFHRGKKNTSVCCFAFPSPFLC